MSTKIALVGNPNSGKTTLFNELTGSVQYVGNWPGVTVEKKSGLLKKSEDITIVDLPGIYSLSPYTPEEIISRDYIIKEKPDAILNIVDSTNIERNLYLTMQLLETGIPVIVALNMIDVIEKKGEKIDVKLLSKKLGCTVIETSAVKGTGFKEIIKNIKNIKSNNFNTNNVSYNKDFDDTINKIENEISSNVKDFSRWYAFKLFEKDTIVTEELKLTDSIKANIDNFIKEYENLYNDDCESIITDIRYNYISDLLSGIYNKKSLKTNSVSEKIDNIVTNRFLALPIFMLIMWGVYFISIQTIGGITTEYMQMFFDFVGNGVKNWLTSVNTALWLQSLITDGIINGIGAVLVFLPQLMVLFFCLSILEDCGYMSRVAFIMDRIFRSIGLSGKSSIPLIIGAGCSVPGIMSSRTIENDKSRRMTILLTPFIPCTAKLPVFALIAGAVLPEYSFAAPSMYFAGIIMIIVSGLILKRTKYFKSEDTPFVMEMPDYRMPNAKSLFIHMWDRSKDFIVKAGTIIFAASGIIWFLVSFNFSFEMVDTSNSILAYLGNLIAPIFKPLGFGNWQATIATLTGYAAKENIVATFGIIFNAENNAQMFSNIAFMFENPAAGYAFMIFILFSPPCFAAISAIKKEMDSTKWTVFALSYQLILSYVLSFIVFQTASLIFYGGTSMTTAFIAIILFSLIGLIVFNRIKYRKHCPKCAGNCATCSKAKK